jgi:hypothetical protein
MASVKFSNLEGFGKSLERGILKKLEGLEAKIAAIAVQSKNKAYAGAFSRDPVDTGDAKSRTITDVQVNKRDATLKIIFEILPSASSGRSWKNGSVNDYAIFFIAPVRARNPNYKYGERNTIKWARDETARVLGFNKK